jgi:hypothetical protein
VVALFLSVWIIRLRQMAAIYRKAFGEFMLIIATWAAIVGALVEQGMAQHRYHGLTSASGIRPERKRRAKLAARRALDIRKNSVRDAGSSSLSNICA